MEVRSKTIQFHVDDRAYTVKLPMEAIDRAMDAYRIRVWRKEAELDTRMSLAEIKSFINRELVKSINTKGSKLNCLCVILRNAPHIIDSVSEQMARFIMDLHNSLEASIDKGEHAGRYIYSSAGEKSSVSEDLLTFEEYCYIDNPKNRELKRFWLNEIEKAIINAGPVTGRPKSMKAIHPLLKKTSKLRKEKLSVSPERKLSDLKETTAPFEEKASNLKELPEGGLSKKGVIKTFKEACYSLFRPKWLKIKAKMLKGI